jgi:bifunctional UDP-N-acetylglucosamine pyrophosphorylase / glucosamine-1-phosphate N-acetyltransferase
MHVMASSFIALILAAGLGTRMKSERSKVLHPVAGRPLIAWAVNCARQAGAARVVTVLGHQHEQVQAVLDQRYGAGAVDVALQREQKGTGHAVQIALAALESESDDRVAVILSGDAPLLPAARVGELVEACWRSAAGIALLSTRPTEHAAYGRLLRDEQGRLVRIIEERDASLEQRAITEMNAGFYAVTLGVLRAAVANLTADNAQGELYLTDMVVHAKGLAEVIEVPFDEVRGVNDRADLAAVETLARRRINRWWMVRGVSMPAPEQVFIDADISDIGADSLIGPGVHLQGDTRVGKGVRLDAGAVITDTTIADGAWIKPYSVLAESQVGPGAQVGPFAHCRPGTRLDEEVKVGNFVETKKAHLMAGAKANHLAYLGDASVGARANIGAGTITCNYDGVKKYQTTIEAGAFIGSDSQLVAPVTIGRDAYVGSGTTVTRDVPRGSLALSRTKQVNVDGWADRFREAQTKRSKG